MAHRNNQHKQCRAYAHKHKRQTQTGRAQAAVICVCGWRVLRGIWLSVVPSRCHERR